MEPNAEGMHKFDYDQQCGVGQGKTTQHWYCKDKVLYCSPDSLATQSASKTDFHLKTLYVTMEAWALEMLTFSIMTLH